MAVEPRRIALWTALVGGLLAAAGAWLWLGVEWVEQEVDLGYGSEARRVRYLAAQRFLEREGVAVEVVSGFGLLDELPPADDLMLLPTPRHTLSRRRLDALRGWLSRGGRALVVAHEWSNPDTLESRDGLLQGYGIHRLPDHWTPRVPDTEPAEGWMDEDPGAPDEPAPEDGAEDDEAADPEEPPGTSLGELLEAARPGQLPGCWPPETTMELLDGERTLSLELSEPGRLYYEGEDGALRPSPDGDELLRADVGEGRLTVLTTALPFTNRRIHCHDHAWFLWSLARSSDRVWLVHDPDVRTLPALVVSALPLGTLGVALWLGAWLGRHSLRFGRAKAGDDGQRRRWLEHLEAGCEFRWRHGQLGPTLQSLVDDLEGRAAVRLPGFATADGVARVRALAERSRLSAQAVQEALSGDVPRTRRELVRRIARLQTIRRQL